jgi:hypothetical protein
MKLSDEMPLRRYELTTDEMAEIMRIGEACGYFEWQSPNVAEALRYIRLEVEAVLQSRDRV